MENGYYAVAFFILRLVGVLMTAVGLMVWIIFLANAWYRGPAHSPPELQEALLMLLFPALALVFCVLCRPLARLCDPTRRPRRP